MKGIEWVGLLNTASRLCQTVLADEHCCLGCESVGHGDGWRPYIHVTSWKELPDSIANRGDVHREVLETSTGIHHQQSVEIDGVTVLCLGREVSDASSGSVGEENAESHEAVGRS